MPKEPKPSKTSPGSREEIREIEMMMDQTAAGRGSLVFLTGPEGLGRSMACHELGEIARKKGFMTVALECRADSEEFWLYSEIKKMIEDRSIPEIGTVSALGIRKLPKEGEDQHLFNEWFTLISDTSKAKPLFITVDDAENSDQRTFRMLHYLALRLKNIRALVVCALNQVKLPDTGIDQIFTRMKQDGVIRIIAMKPLGIRETEALIASVIGIEHAPSELCSAIYDITQGYPKFVKEMADSVLGFMRRRGVTVDTVDILQLEVPAGIIRRYQERVKTLNEDELEVCRLAACIGGKFSLEILQPLLGKEEDAILDIIESMISKGFIREGGEGNYFTFVEKHFVEYAYNSMMDEAARRTRHKKIADILEKEVDIGKEMLITEMGRQYALAGEYVAAYKAYVRAGDKAKVIYANEDAMQFYNLAMKCMRMAPERFDVDSRMTLLSNLADVEIAMGLLDEAESNLQTLAGMRKDRGDLRGECEVYIQLGDLYRTKRRFDSALKVFTDAYNTALSIQDNYLISDALKHIGGAYYYMNEPDKAAEYVTASIKGTNPADDPVAYAKKVSLLGSIHSLKGEYPRSTELYREAIAFLSKRDPREEARVRRFLAETLKFMGDFRGCLSEAEESAKLANVTQYTAVESIAHSIAGEAHAMLGDKDKAKDQLDIAEKLVRDTRDRVAEIMMRISRGAYFTVIQEYKKAIADLEAGVELARRIGLLVYEAEGLFRLGVAHHYSHHELKKRDNIRDSYNSYKKLGNRERAMLCKAWLES